MNKKIFWDIETGTVYWFINRRKTEDIGFAPMNNDGTCNLGDGGIVETWEEITPEHKALIISKLT